MTRLALVFTLALSAGCAAGERVAPTDHPPIRSIRDETQSGAVSPSSPAARGPVPVDLGDGFAPRVLRGTPYEADYVRLANERFGPDDARAREDHYLELYGIFPSLSVMRARMLDADRHTCHAAVDDAAIEAQDSDAGPPADSVRAVQAHLRCDGLLSPRARDGVLDRWTRVALGIWQRRHMVVSLSIIDTHTRAGLTTDSRELDFRQLLRGLRERVVDATGLIEDGTANGEPAPVVGRVLGSAEFRQASETHAPLPGGAPDLIGRATDAAARELGWTDPDAAQAWLVAHEDTARLVVPLQLPPPPAYHATHMDLRVEIDRGDVWYEHPYTPEGERRAQPIERRPTLVVWAADPSAPNGEIAVVRWNTTIGGWKEERSARGAVALRYQESDVGPRVWRDLIAGPAWLPPDSTPNDVLVRRAGGRWVLNRELFGPSYRSAYGMLMLVHHEVDASGELVDHQIRVHGSSSYPSILRGTSHGCHRLFNHQAVHLGAFLLAHRNHADRGDVAAAYEHEFRIHGRSYRLAIESRGHRYELTPPIAVNVLPGNVRGDAPDASTRAFALPTSPSEMNE